MLRGLEQKAAMRRVRARAAKAGAAAETAGPDEPPPGTDTLPQIEHIVILMMENHSYDNYLGMLAGRGDGLTIGPDGKPVETNPAPDGSPVPLRRFDGTAQVSQVPSQSWHASHLQWNEGACDGFVRYVDELTPGLDPAYAMRYFDETDLPFYYSLARTFPLATRWFCSCLGPTFPNRRFLISGTANGLIDDVPFAMIDEPTPGTIFDQLTAHGISWINYHQMTPLQVNWRRVWRSRGLRRLRLLAGAIGSLIPGMFFVLVSKAEFTANLYPLRILNSINHLRPMSDFWTAVQAGKLPAVSYVDPDYRNASEENPQDIANGEAFVAQVINAVMAGPGWPRTLLIWLYDEHGGYYDHVPPLPAVAPDDVPAQSILTRFPILRLIRWTPLGRWLATSDLGPDTYTVYGFRVPAVIVSPLARPDFVTDQVYDHTSALKTIERKWSLPALGNRDAAAADVLDALDLEGPPAFLTPPVLAKPKRGDPA
jgi:phospholipase C